MKVLTDIVLVASNHSTEPKGPDGYTSIGYWDVDDGGAHGTGGTKGDYMAALYVKFEDVVSLNDREYVQDVFLTASDRSTPTSPNSGGFHNIGYWDVDDGGALGTNGSRGDYMMGMYIRGMRGGNYYISDILLTASNNSFPNTLGADSDYTLVGYWDVDDGGSVGTQGEKGDYMMGLFVQYSLS